MIRIALALVLATTVAAADDWQTITSTEGHFGVSMPGAPTPTRAQQDSPLGMLDELTYSVWSGGERFTLRYTLLPKRPFYVGTGTIYDHTRDGVLAKTGGTASSYGDATVAGSPGKRLVYDVPARDGHPAMQGTTRMLIVGNDLYVADTAVPAGGASTNATRFLDSLRIEAKE